MSNDSRISNNSSIFKTIVFADHASAFAPTTANDLRNGDNYENVQMIFDTRATGEAFQSAKFDFGVDRAPTYLLIACLEYVATATDGEVGMSFRVSPSTQSTPANGNVGYPDIDGVADTNAEAITESDGLYGQLTRVGGATLQAIAAAPQIMIIGTYSPLLRWATLVCENDSTTATHTDAIEAHAVFVPIGYNN